MTSWNSYGKIYNLGHRATQELLDGPVTIEEKIDGSQFSFGMIDGELLVRSRGRIFDINEADSLFSGACDTITSIAHLLQPGVTYRGEVLSKPRHNALAYERIPKGHIIIWDIAIGDQDYMNYADKKKEATRLGLEVSPLFFQGTLTDLNQLNQYKTFTSILGGPIEGYVIKNYAKFGTDKKTLMGKWVSESFKEVHRGKSYSDRPQKMETSLFLTSKYVTKARWEKAVQRLRDNGELEGSMRDMRKLVKEIPSDIKAECIDEIKEDLFKAYWANLQRTSCKGLAEWYKEKLAAEATISLKEF